MDTTFPRISVVTPSFNQVRFLEATINSVLSQNYSNLEYIIIDGGSKDGSVDIIKKYEAYLHFWCSEPDHGQYDAINKGFSKSTGDILAWLNSDDMFLPWTFKTIAGIMSTFPKIEWLTTLQQGQWDWHGFFLGVKMIPGYSREAFLEGRYLPGMHSEAFGHVQQESTFWTHNLWNKVGAHLSTEYALASDFDLWARFYEHADLYGTPSPLGGFRSHIDQQSSTQPDLYLKEATHSLERMRTALHWSSTPPRSMGTRRRLNLMPILKGGSESTPCYHGKRVLRKNLGSSQNRWEIEEYTFQ